MFFGARSAGCEPLTISWQCIVFDLGLLVGMLEAAQK